MQGFKKFWNDWSWSVALVALLYSVFLFYHNSTSTTPMQIQDCQQQIKKHVQEANEHFAQLDKSVSELNVVNAGISAQLSAIKDDTAITKKLVFELLGKRL